ncbi:MAG: ABC transporter permease [Planctomycetales bacterium]|nr:ABC transporter permease [Planctomycetales bacterium]
MILQALSTIRLGLKSLAIHKLRSTLATLGIVLGVASVILMLAVGEAARYEAVRQIKDMGATNIIVRSVKPARDSTESASGGAALAYGLTRQDLDRIVMTIPTARHATPMRESRREVRYLELKLEGRVVGVKPNFPDLNGLRVARGRFLNEYDEQQYANVAVLGAATAEKLFPFENPIGRSVRIEKQYFQVVGVTQRHAASMGVGANRSAQDFNGDVYIPFDTDWARFGKILTYERAGTWEAEKLEISELTVSVADVAHVKETARIIEGLIKQFHKKEDTAMFVPLDLLERIEQAQRTFTLVLGAIASISLMVGGIGIMNIMLATVTERTREIGVRRAMGAKRSDITWQFLVETVVLTAGGGLLGVAVGITLAHLVTHIFDLKTIVTVWSPALAVAVSVVVGVLFGVYPARSAARLDPIEALRHE